MTAGPTNGAQGRLDHGPPVSVIDIGSNSVRLVVYEGLTRSPTPIFNEKVLAGLGREVHSTGLLAADAVDKALGALKRFRALCDRMGVAPSLRSQRRRQRLDPRRRRLSPPRTFVRFFRVLHAGNNRTNAQNFQGFL